MSSQAKKVELEPELRHMHIEPGEWSDLDSLFHFGEASRLVGLLRRECNMPVEVGTHPWIDAKLVEDMNQVLVENSVPLRLSCLGDVPWKLQQVRFIRL